jgi:hypothetical protein
LGYGYGYGPYTYGYGYGPRYYSVRHYDRDGEGAIRVLVDPNKTRVYVDGYYAGTADDFDGMFQRLYVRSGRHQITLKLEGYKTRHFRVFVPFDDTVKIKLDMESGTGEVEAEDVIGRPEDARGFEDERRQRATDWQRQRGHVPDADDADDAADDDDADDTPDVRGEMAIVQLDVAPPDATVYVDGEFQGRGERVRSLSLPPGKHRIEIVRPGYRTLEREIDVRAGSRTNLDLTLER